jgi:hypothetical protein
MRAEIVSAVLKAYDNAWMESEKVDMEQLRDGEALRVKRVFAALLMSMETPKF